MTDSAKTLKAKIVAAQVEKRHVELSGPIDTAAHRAQTASRVSVLQNTIDGLLDEYSALLQPV